MSYNAQTQDYRQEIEIPEDEIGDIDFSIVAYNMTGQKTKLVRHLFVKLPPNVTMQSIVAGDDLMVLYMALSGSSPEDKDRIETDQISVAGIYSDGVKRLITSSAMGTTYASSDEKIVTVDSGGKLTAKGLGRAKITVRNGKYSAEIKIVVKPY
jgi:hypothetical protein